MINLQLEYILRTPTPPSEYLDIWFLFLFYFISFQLVYGNLYLIGFFT